MIDPAAAAAAAVASANALALELGTSTASATTSTQAPAPKQSKKTAAAASPATAAPALVRSVSVSSPTPSPAARPSGTTPSKADAETVKAEKAAGHALIAAGRFDEANEAFSRALVRQNLTSSLSLLLACLRSSSLSHLNPYFFVCPCIFSLHSWCVFNRRSIRPMSACSPIAVLRSIRSVDSPRR